MVTKSIENAQKKVEGQNFDRRKNVLEYDDVMNQQRKTIYALRRQVLDGRYHREPTEEEEKAGIVPEPVTESGNWTVEALTPDAKKRVTEMVQELKKKVAERDEAVARGEEVNDTRPGWRILRAELWRYFSTLVDVEKPWDGPEDALVELCTKAVVASQIQQRERLYDLAHERMAAVLDEVLDPEKLEDDWDWDELEDALKAQFNIDFEMEPGTPDEAAHQAWPQIEKRLGEREQELSRDWLLYFQRHFMLEEIDHQWIEHLKLMDGLREGIGLQGYGQMDPKQEYKKAGYTLFHEMMKRIQENAVNKIFRVIPQAQAQAKPVPVIAETEREMIERGVADKSDEEVDQAAKAAGAARRSGKARTAGEGATTAPVKRERPKVGRNDPCPCGSGKKYKKCHGKDEEAAASGE
jgi:preprotein translocase subunit SecA